MSAVSGTAGSVVVGTVVVGDVQEWSLNPSMDPIETSAFGDTWKTYVASLRGATGNFSLSSDSNNTGQTTLTNSVLGGSAVALKLYETSTKYWNIGTAFLTQGAPRVSHNGKNENSYNFQVSGPVTYV